ncbi:MAG: hypothetical protein QM705_14495 [Ancrocorticia sp.]
MYVVMLSMVFLPVLLPLTLAWVIGRGHPRPTMPPNLGPHAQKALRAARTRVLVAVAIFLLAPAVFAGARLGIPMMSSEFGRMLLVMPFAATSIGILAYVVYPIRGTDSLPQQSASLAPRTWRDSLTLGAVAGWIAAAVSLVVAIVGFGVTSSPDGAGRYRMYTAVIHYPDFDTTSTTSPYPGWYYTVPVLVAAAVLVLVTWFALRRTSLAPSLPGVGLERADARWRQDSADIILRLSAGALFVQSAVISWMGLTCLQNMLPDKHHEPGMIASTSVFDSWGTSVVGLGALALTIAGIAYLLSAFVGAVSLPSKAIQEQNRELSQSSAAVFHLSEVPHSAVVVERGSDSVEPDGETA